MINITVFLSLTHHRKWTGGIGEDEQPTSMQELNIVDILKLLW